MKNFSEFQHPSDYIVAIMQRLYDGGMTTTSGGNLSIMDSDNNLWISPGGVDKGTLTRNDIMCVKADGSIEGIHKPSSEYPFHRDTLKNLPGARALLHAHPPALVAFSVASQVPETKVDPISAQICGQVGFAPYDVPGSEALGKKVSAEFQNGYSAILLENHGSCVEGANLLEAFQRFETLDFCARALLNAVQLGTPRKLSESELKLGQLDRNQEFKKSTPQIHSSSEQEQRLQLAKLTRRTYRQQLCSSLIGTFSARVGASSFIISKRGVDRGTMTEDDFILVDGINCEAPADLERECWLIRRIFAARPELNAVIFAQPPHLMGYAVTQEEFDPRVIPESYILLREMPAFKYETLYNQTDKLLQTLSLRYPIVLLKNTGIISCGRTPLEAFDRLEVAEYSAKATIAARRLGGLHPIAGKQLDDLVAAFNLVTDAKVDFLHK